jgi:glycosyltransferase involved in cell wall biosynthesis
MGAGRDENRNAATFVMPHYCDRPQAGRWLDVALEGLLAQTDDGWILVIVDYASPRRCYRVRLLAIARKHDDRVFVLLGEHNQGAGVCRNIGIRWANARGSSLVLFHDADDVSHPRRLERVKQIFDSRPAADFLYGSVLPVDEHGAEISRTHLIPSLREILESHDGAAVEGQEAWIRMGTETGYTCVTSTVAVRTKLAVAHQFPAVRFSEDTHTWLRMSAGGAHFVFASSIPTRYRVPQDVQGQSSRHRLGEACHRIKVRTDSDGFARAIELALDRNAVTREQVPELWERFYLRLEKTMRGEGQDELANNLLDQARLAQEGFPSKRTNARWFHDNRRHPGFT